MRAEDGKGLLSCIFPRSLKRAIDYRVSVYSAWNPKRRFLLIEMVDGMKSLADMYRLVAAFQNSHNL